MVCRTFKLNLSNIHDLLDTLEFSSLSKKQW